jgi:hypothetical protein
MHECAVAEVIWRTVILLWLLNHALNARTKPCAAILWFLSHSGASSWLFGLNLGSGAFGCRTGSVKGKGQLVIAVILKN